MSESTDIQTRSCAECIHAVFQETGYSNYTVEGRDFWCSKNLHPDDGFDAWYDRDDRLKFAEECPEYWQGEPISIDVDQEELVSLSPDRRAIYDETMKRAYGD
jgi:hypothetical protein